MAGDLNAESCQCDQASWVLRLVQPTLERQGQWTFLQEQHQATPRLQVQPLRPRRRRSAQRQEVEARPGAQPRNCSAASRLLSLDRGGNISRKLTPSQGVSGRCSCSGTRFTTLTIGTAGPVAGETCRARVGIDVPCPARPCTGVSFFRSRSWTRTAQPFIRACHSFTVMVIGGLSPRSMSNAADHGAWARGFLSDLVLCRTPTGG
jgi:hypothetical protein